MKKLIIAAAIVCAAVVSQAASVVWSTTSAMTAHNSGKTAGANEVMMYVFEAVDYSAYASLSGAELSLKLWEDFGSSLDDATKSAGTSARGIATVNGPANYTAGDTFTGAILFVDTKDDYFMGNIYTGTIPTSGNGKATNLATTYGGTAAGGTLAWANVPEPTSGLLLLLGMAGMALRRRRA